MKHLAKRRKVLEQAAAEYRWTDPFAPVIALALTRLTVADRNAFQNADYHSIRSQDPELWKRFDDALAVVQQESSSVFSFDAVHLLL